MIITGCVISAKEGKAEEAAEILRSINGVDVFEISEEKSAVVVTAETEGDHELQEITDRLLSEDCIIDVAHHYMHFEEEVEKSGEKIDEEQVKALFKSLRGE